MYSPPARGRVKFSAHVPLHSGSALRSGQVIVAEISFDPATTAAPSARNHLSDAEIAGHSDAVREPGDAIDSSGVVSRASPPHSNDGASSAAGSSAPASHPETHTPGYARDARQQYSALTEDSYIGTGSVLL